MLLLPIEHITYSTKLSEEEIIIRLGDWVESALPPELFQLRPSYEKRYQGKIKDHNFNIERIIGYRNSFLPTITGSIKEGLNKTTVKVEIRLNFFAMMFMVLWCGGFGQIGFSVLTNAYNGAQLDEQDLFPLGMALGGYVICMIAFKIESYISRKELKTIFDAEIIHG